MIINFFRSSSFSNWSFCQQQYFITYVLGFKSRANKKADKGTIVHKVMEVLANCKKLMQDQKDFAPFPDQVSDKHLEFSYMDEHIGEVTWFSENFLKPYPLSNTEIDVINKTRINKYKYKSYAKIPYGTIHYGVDFVEDIFDRTYKHYAGEDWAPVDRKDCNNWTWMALEYMDGKFDPRRLTIVAAEPHFDFEIDKPWANYEWNLPNGEKISGKLGIKGTIDLIASPQNGIIEIQDYKTGSRIDWGCKTKNNEKTYEKLCSDFQLMLYYYAAKKMYPDIKQVIVSIFWIRDGGVFTINMDDEVVQQVENRLCKRFQEVSACQFPAMQDVTQRDFRCTKLCEFYKMVAPNGDNMCKFLHNKIKTKGIDWVTNEYTREGFSVGTYNAPGEKE